MVKKYPYLYEIPLVYLFFSFINVFFFAELPGFIEIDPHPYWLGILLFGFRYGVLAGLLSGLVSAFLYMASAWFLVERYLFEDLSFYLLPSLFMIIGAFIGVGVEGYHAQIKRLGQDKDVLESDREKIKDEMITLSEINQGLEKRIVTKMATLITLYQGAKALEAVELTDLYKAILQFIQKTLEADEISIYLKQDSAWKLALNSGWKDYQSWPTEISLNQGLIGLAGFQKKIVTIRDFMGADSHKKDSPNLIGDCLFAGPLCQGESGEVVGVVAIQKIPFTHFNSATINLFSFLLMWASRSIGRSQYVHDLQSHEIIDPEYQIYSYSYLSSRFDQEFSRSQTYYLPLSFGLVKVNHLDQVDADKRTKVMTLVCQMLKERLRDMDVISRYPDKGIPFCFLLITSSDKQAAEVVKALYQDYQNLIEQGVSELKGFKIEIGIDSFTPKKGSASKMIEQALKNLHG